MELNAKRLYLRPRPDRTFEVSYDPADEVDAISNHRFQKILFSAYDLYAACEAAEDRLPDEVVLAMHTMKQRVREAAAPS